MKNRERTTQKGPDLKNIFSSFRETNQLPTLSRQILRQKSHPEMFLEQEKVTLEPDYKPEKGPISRLKKLKKKLIYQWHKAKAGFWGHFSSFLAVSAFLVFLNITTGGSHPWAYYPIMGWGIGVLCHIQSIQNQKREMEELLPLKGISSDDLARIREIQKATSVFRDHLMSYLAVIGFLFGINLITSGLSTAWFLYPAAGWFIGLFAHFNAYRAKKKSLLTLMDNRFIEETEAPSTTQFVPQRQKQENTILAKAILLKDKLYTQWQENQDLRKLWGEEVPDLLAQYIKQISGLCDREKELKDLLEEIDVVEKQNKLKELEEKLGQTNNPLLVKEYKKAIEQTQHHIQSLKTITEQKELISLRIDAAVSLLQQMQLSAARMQSIDKIAEDQSLQDLKIKTRELSDYLDDLETSYNELDI